MRNENNFDSFMYESSNILNGWETWYIGIVWRPTIFHEKKKTAEEGKRKKEWKHSHMSYRVLSCFDDSLIILLKCGYICSWRCEELNWSQSEERWCHTHEKSNECFAHLTALKWEIFKHEKAKGAKSKRSDISSSRRGDIYVALVFRWRLTYFKYILWLLVTQTFAMSFVFHEKNKKKHIIKHTNGQRKPMNIFKNQPNYTTRPECHTENKYILMTSKQFNLQRQKLRHVIESRSMLIKGGRCVWCLRRHAIFLSTSFFIIKEAGQQIHFVSSSAVAFCRRPIKAAYTLRAPWEDNKRSLVNGATSDSEVEKQSAPTTSIVVN